MSKRMTDLTDEEWELIISRISDNFGFADDDCEEDETPDTLLHFELAWAEQGGEI